VPAPGGVVDGRPPTVTVQVLSRLRSVRRTGRLALRIGSSEPSLVALSGTVRPGLPLAHAHRARAAAFRSPIRLRSALLAFRSAGGLRVTIAVSRSAQRRLGRARDGRLSLGVLAVDAARYQAARRIKRHIAR